MQEAKASSAIENILTTDDELYKAYSEQKSEQLDGPAKEVLRYREALLAGHAYLKTNRAARKNLNRLVEMNILALKVINGNHYYQNLELDRILAE